ncbi:hypothetical protein BGX26_000865, partial [Mortierella sp. AD094]
MSEPVNAPIPTVLIVGAGFGGLMLGAILESADISYHILERATELRSLGSAIALSGNIFPLFEQLGIYEELKSVSLPHISIDFYDRKLNALESIDDMLNQFQDFPCAFGGTMKEIFDATPKNLILKVFLEEKVFQTWYNGRSVLIGDACHKLLPGAGQ